MTDLSELAEPEDVDEADLKRWIGVVEDKAWDAQAEASACRFVLGNLLVELQAKGVINAGAFIAKLRQAALQDTDNGPARFGICELLDSLHLHFHEQPSRQSKRCVPLG